MIRMFFYSGVQVAISFSYVVSVTSRATDRQRSFDTFLVFDL